MKRFIPLLLVVLAFLYGIPREACACAQKPVETIGSPADDSCCSGGDFESSCQAGPILGKAKDCCKMMVQDLPVAGSSVELLNGTEQLNEVLADLARLFAYVDSKNNEHVAYANRAPPHIRGFGSSDTYLFKRVFLI